MTGIDRNGVDSARGLAAARQAAPTFPRRFYTSVDVQSVECGFALRLDGKPARTPGRNPFVLPTRALAEAAAREWESVEDVIDPRRMPLTRLANTVIDGVSRRQDEVLGEVVRFMASDLLLYRATEPADLVRLQDSTWDPILEWSRSDLGAPLTVAQGIVFVPQPPDSLRRLADVLRTLAGTGPGAPYRLAALHVMTTLTGSALLAAAVAAGRISVETAWSAAHVDEDHQISLWGADDEAVERRSARWTEMRAAAEVFRLAAPDGPDKRAGVY